ncbi:MAG TPA: M24 family metallopeptidase [Thermoleophilaceae bacterium]|nr:M24 family metallopeptidase [Thermoleophilaceae bacterium]
MRADTLHALVDRHDAGALVLRDVANFAWYTHGGDSRVDHANPLGVADVVITRGGEYVVTSSIEAPRMREEQTPAYQVVEYPWHQGADATLRDLAGGREAILDSDPRVRDDISRMRVVLDERAQSQLRVVGRDTAAALANTADLVEPGMSEHEAAGLLAMALRSRNLAPHVLLAATDERIRRHRHALPFGAQIEKRVMLVASAERHGLYANITLIRNFEDPDPETQRRMDACSEILARAHDATRPGRTLADVFADIQRFYAEAGFADEWRLHHQGGSTGYRSRETIATAGTDDEIEVGMAFAWNPSISGAKAEETFLLAEEPMVVCAPARVPARA